MIARHAVLVLLCLTWVSMGCRSQTSSTSGAVEPQKVSAKSISARLFSIVKGKSSLMYVKTAGANAPHRLTNRKSGWETGGVLSPDGNVVAYASADAPDAKSEVWISRLDGSDAHRVSSSDEDALMPAFGAGARTLLYVKSGFYGHYSPIAASRRHKLDVMKVVIDADSANSGSKPVQLTQQEFYDVISLSVSPDGKKFLVSTSGYPIGSLLEEFEMAKPLRIHAIFQPHVPSETSSGPNFGQAAYVHDGRDIVFTAATGGFEYDYNVYQISDVTGADLVALTHQTGIIDDMSVDRDGTIFIVRGDHRYSLDATSRAIREDHTF